MTLFILRAGLSRLIPRLIRPGLGFWWSLLVGAAVTVMFHLVMVRVTPRFNLPI